MRKLLLIYLSIICLLLTGCSKEKDIYEHYDLSGKDLNKKKMTVHMKLFMFRLSLLSNNKINNSNT